MEHYLWPLVNRLNMRATPGMLFAMLKAASLAGDFHTAAGLLDNVRAGAGYDGSLMLARPIAS